MKVPCNSYSGADFHRVWFFFIVEVIRKEIERIMKSNTRYHQAKHEIITEMFGKVRKNEYFCNQNIKI